MNNLSPEEFKRINLGTSLKVNNFNLRFCDQNECVIMRWSDVINNSHPLSFKTKVILPSGEKKQTVYNEARVKLLMNKKKQNEGQRPSQWFLSCSCTRDKGRGWHDDIHTINIMHYSCDCLSWSRRTKPNLTWNDTGNQNGRSELCCLLADVHSFTSGQIWLRFWFGQDAKTGRRGVGEVRRQW